MSKAIERAEQLIVDWGRNQLITISTADLRALVAAAKRCEEYEILDVACAAARKAFVETPSTPRSTKARRARR